MVFKPIGCESVSMTGALLETSFVKVTWVVIGENIMLECICPYDAEPCERIEPFTRL